MHVEPLPSGSFRVTVSYLGRRRRGTAATRREAEILGGRLLAELGAGIDPTMTLGELLDRHIEENRYAETTRADYRSVAAKLGEHRDLRIERITTGRLVALYAALSREGWTDHRVSRAHEVISSAFARAVRHDALPSNPATGASPGRPARPEIVPPTDEEVVRLLDAADGVFVTAVVLDADIGARRGEIAGLQWGDFDLDAGSVQIVRAVAYTPAAGVHVKELKNADAGRRRAALDPDTVAAIKAHRAQVRADRLRLGVGAPDPAHFVFSHKLGSRPWRPDYLTHRWADLRAKVGLEHVTFGALRHYVATSMLTAGESPAVVAGRLGHDPVTMMRRYWHFVPGADADAAKRHGDRLRQARTGSA